VYSVALQWPVVQCCRKVSTGMCLENLGGIFQVVIQWALFTTTLVLFLIFFPPHLKYAEVQPELAHRSPKPLMGLRIGFGLITTAEWRLAVVFSCIVALHMLFCTFITALLIQDLESSAFAPWTTFLGVSGALCTAIQFIPQIYKTWNSKLVGSLSILMMCIQSPGAVVMCLSIAIRPGTNWTSWATYAAAGSLQSILLAMCLCWKDRQARLGIDDFGRPLSMVVTPGVSSESRSAEGAAHNIEDERSPLFARS